MVWLILYAVLINLAALIVFGVDKKRARRHEWRISERTLFLLALAGGSVGAILGMLVFRHKTRKWYFMSPDIRQEKSWIVIRRTRKASGIGQRMSG